MKLPLSIRHRLAATASLLVVVVGAVNAAAAYREFRRSEMGSAHQRVGQVARQLGDMLGAQAGQLREQMRLTARDSALAPFMRDPSPAHEARVRDAFAAVARAVPTGGLELWTPDGRRVWPLHDTLPAIAQDEAARLSARARASGGAAIGWFGTSTGRLTYAIIAAIPGAAGVDSVAGYVIERRLATATERTSAQLRDLIAPGATVILGNTRGDGWTDFARAESPPPVTLRDDDSVRNVEYERPAGRPSVAAIAPIRNTPWSIGVELPMSVVLAPVHEMLGRLALSTLLLVVIAGAGAWISSRTLTKPITALVAAAQGMRAGDESERVTVERMDELGVLGASFNAMADRIAKSRASLTALVHDVTDAEARLERVVASSSAVLYELRFEATGPVLDWISHNITRQFGYDRADVESPQWWSSNVHPEDREEIGRLEAPEKSRDAAHEYRFRHKDGTYRWLRDEQRVTRDAAGAVRIVGAWLDITEQRQIEERLRQTQKMEAVGRLAGGVAHDFNNLLTVISGFTDLMISGRRQTDPDLEPLREVKGASTRAAALTRQLLAFSRQQVMRAHNIDLNMVIGDAENMLRRLSGEEVTMSVRLDPEIPWVRADPGQVEQVLVNLVVNARDAMPSGGRLTIETRPAELDDSFVNTGEFAEPGRYVAIVVADTGTGMPAHVRDRIFEPFFTTKEPGKGTGLGLSTVHGIVEQSGGRIFVYSEPGQGTTFKLFLPCVPAVADPPDTVSRVAAHRAGTESILLVEDEPAVRRVTKTVLTRAGYSVVEAVDGESGLALCADPAVRFDLVVTDMVMPGIGGRDLARQVRAQRPGTPMVFISGYTRTAVDDEELIANALFVEKPFTSEALLVAVREMLDRASAARRTTFLS